MALSIFNWILLTLSFITAVPGSALLWRVYDALDASIISNPLQRLAQYESCSFIFYFIANLAILLIANKGQTTAVLRVLSVGILFFITVYGDYVNFTNLNNLRIVDMANSGTSYTLPVTENVVDNNNQRKLLGGLILGYFSLLFGLLSTLSGEMKLGGAGKGALFFWFFALILAIPGVVVSWSNNDAPTYKQGSSTQLLKQTNLFFITTTTLVEWIVLTLGLLNSAEDLLAASGFIFGLAGLYFPINYFYIQFAGPDNADYIWAGPILCWIATFFMAISATLGQSARKEATV